MSEPAKPAPKKGGKKKLIIIVAAAVVLLGGGGAGVYFSGVLSHKKPAAKQDVAVKGPAAPAFADMPEIVANLNGSPHRPSYIKLKAKVELARPEDQAALTAAMPRLLDMFQTYLREMRPEELRGSAGTYRLREELIARANIAVAPAEVTDVLFTEMLIQ